VKATRPTWCGLCHARCGLLMDFENGRAVAVRGDPEHPVNQGRTCSRGRMILEHLYNEDRLDVPLRRVGRRGSGKWERVSWNAALDEIAERLADLKARFGAETAAVTRGTYRTYEWDFARFLNLFGSPNRTGANPVCYCPSVVVETAICGSMPDPDISRARCVVIWGSCRSTSSPVTIWHALRKARERGARFITVDPRHTPEAEMSDLWLPVRPGTDPVLMLGWIHIICSEQLWDREFVEQWTIGFEELRRLAAEFPPERVSRITGIPEDDIVAAARLYATTKPAAFAWGFGVDKIGPNAQASAHARSILRAITGNLDVAGGDLFGNAPRTTKIVSNLDMEKNEALPPEQRAKLIGGSQHPLFSFAAWDRHAAAVNGLPKDYLTPTDTATAVVGPPREIFNAMITGKPYPVRALFTYAANPLLTLADPRRTQEALQALDLLVVMDYYLTPTAASADFVLPAASTVERDDLTVHGTSCFALPRALAPLAERRSDYELWMELGRRLGQTEHWPWDSAREVCEYRLAPAGLSFDDLIRQRAVLDTAEPGRSRQLGFGTPSGKVELRSSIFDALGCDPLPHPLPVAETDEQFPLILITGSNFNPMYHSEQRQWPSARARCPDPLVSVHPDTAAELGIVAGDWVRILTAHGSIRQRAELSDLVSPHIVDTQHGWWYPERKEDDPLGGFLESNCNVLVSDAPAHCSPGTGGWTQSGIPCRLEREDRLD